ncbi:TPA: GNAT family N-acetyltransferase [Vibrio vulnificus]|uniref:GNAT family N-acetyltransferase n=1 Tax=Vibrio vulnificus TaxID=672 RepID=UPI0005771CCD|nr:GNAT family N-acetyltransferase [Vibrio vulnificus]AVW99070.1 hypothetical protein BJD94_03645 [Vibrio vulnificus Env1]EGQ7936586.1 GNAT family N-acetyltransferase [Vibrio vulnificus]EGQ7984346.1 GNAT family N-acetyltransferase [Vibrio vulnificus]EGQ9279663.1 GNAT family N-acetyltransferase [Vibrio vulnificus]EGQ9294115.1 GNAT family N-acetyltransferase [Vibrio vulnificus]
MYEIYSINAREFLSLSKQFVSEELAQNAFSYINTNLDEFEKFAFESNSQDRYKHVVAYALNADEKIIGFRYYFFKPDSAFCHLFATFVDVEFRQKGIASNLILQSFNDARDSGCTEFEIRLTRPNIEKDGLFELYKNYASNNEKECKFTIYYWTQVERYGYA